MSYTLKHVSTRILTIDRAIAYSGFHTVMDAEAADAAEYEAEIDRILDWVGPLADGPVTRAMVRQRMETLRANAERVASLRKLPVVVQRSPEWYALRQDRVTASDLAQALGFGKFGTQRDFYIKKAGYAADTFNSSAPPLRWGVKYEPVIAALYKLRMHVELYDFGLLPHPHVPYFGASPDGISEFGVMVEMKAPYRRQITGEIPEQYYYQIQGQLDVCDLDECDYVEVEFAEYADAADAAADTAADATDPDATAPADRGVLVERAASDGSLSHEYGPINVPVPEMVSWAAPHIATGARAVYWRVVTFHMKRIYRDRAFIQARLEELRPIWERVLAYRQDKYLYMREIEDAAPEKRAPRAAASGDTMTFRSFKPKAKPAV